MLIGRLTRRLHRMVALAAFLGSIASTVPAQTAVIAWSDRVTIAVVSADPVRDTKDTLVRIPAAVSDVSLSAFPELLPERNGSFFAVAAARVVVGADDKLKNCSSAGATIRRQVSDAQQPATPIALNVCPVLLASVRFQHAVAITGRAISSTASLSVALSHTHGPLVLVAGPEIPKTSGHVLSEISETTAGRDVYPIVQPSPLLSNAWADIPFWLRFGNPIRVVPPDWSAALRNEQKPPKTARVGAVVKLAALHGLYSFVSCKIIVTSGNASVDAATCRALTSNNGGASSRDAHDGTFFYENYPIVVQWHGRSADIIAPALPSVPHMPRDVQLAAADKPAHGAATSSAVPIRILLDRQGHATDCVVMRGSGDDEWDGASCRLALQRAQFTPALDAFGRPALGLYEAVVDWPAMSIHPARQ